MESENNLSSENIKQIVISGNNIETLKNYPDNYFDSVVTDPPYGLGKEPNAEEMLRAWLDTGYLEVKGVGFMGKEWDAFIPQPLFWKEIFRVLKHGGHVVSFFGTRTYDWGCMAIRLAGFEIRDSISWVYGVGFPKSHNISKAIDKMPKANNRLLEFAELLKHRRNELHFSLSQADDLICKGSTMYNFLEGRNINGVLKVYPPNKEYYEKIKSIYGIQGWDDIVENNLEIVGEQAGNFGFQINGERWNEKTHIKEITTEQAKEWEGWGSALKPAHEDLVLARKPLEKGLSIAENVLKWGTGAINIDASRIGNELIKGQKAGQGFNNVKGFGVNTKLGNEEAKKYISEDTNGRFPANFILGHHFDCEMKIEKTIYTDTNEEESNEVWNCHDDCPIRILDEQSGISKSSDTQRNRNTIGSFGMPNDKTPEYNDKGGASRFFYIAKANKWERNYGLQEFENNKPMYESHRPNYQNTKGIEIPYAGAGRTGNENRNNHPTVKPIKLMQYLVRMITPPNGIVLDPFAGSGTTGIACKIDGFEFVGLELSEDYTKIANARIESFQEEKVFIDETIIYKNRNKEEDENEEDDTNSSTQLSLF
jgi:DNA modification methylase